MLERLKDSLRSSPVVRFGEYHYFVHPLTDGIPAMDPAILREVVAEMSKVGDYDCDLLITPEAMGIHLVVPLSMESGIPYNIVRKRRYGMEGEVSVSQVTGYSRSELFINGISEGTRVTIVDDVLSTGGTLKALVKALRCMGVEIVDIIVAIEKTDHKAEIERELGIGIKTLVKIDVRDGLVVVLS